MFFYALTSAGPEGGVETRAWKARFLTTPRGLADLSVSENNVWSFLLHKVILSLENFGKTLWKVHFCITIMARKKHEGFVGFENACSRVKDLRHHNVT